MSILAAVTRLRDLAPGLRSVRASHHVDNRVARHLYAALGFVEIGEKIDAETGIRDRLVEPGLAAAEQGIDSRPA
jgi:RimJ/RimL family protein N-acetyltransferase